MTQFHFILFILFYFETHSITLFTLSIYIPYYFALNYAYLLITLEPILRQQGSQNVSDFDHNVRRNSHFSSVIFFK